MADVALFDQTERATIIRYRSTVALPTGLDALDPLRSAGQSFVSITNGAGHVRDDHMARYLFDETSSMMFSAFRTSHGAAMNEKRAFLAADANLRTPVASIDRTLDRERRDQYRGGQMKAIVARIAEAPLADLAALVADGNLASLPPEAWVLAEQRFMRLNVLEMTGSRSNFAARPSIENPLAAGVDEAAAEREAEAMLAGHAARGEAVELTAGALRDFVGFLAAAYDRPVSDLFDQALGRT